MKTTRSLGLLTTLIAALAATSCVTTETDEGEGKKDEQPPELDPTVQFPDLAFETCVRETMGLWDVDILKVDAQWVPHLACQDRQIADIAGIEHFTGLTTLALWENEIADLTPLTTLTGLVDLQLGNNNIIDLWPLAGLVGLQKLGLSVNGVADLTPLSGLVELRWLNLDVNIISDIWPIAGLPNLTWLTVDHNPIGAHPALVDLDNRGIDVYADFPEGSFSQPDMSQIAGPAPGRDLRDRGQLALELGAEGELSLGWNVDGTRHRVYGEFAGQLEVVDGKIHYRTGHRDVVVGEQTAKGFELCSGDYAEVCHFAVGAKSAPAMRSPLARKSLDGTATQPVFTAALTLADGAERVMLDNGPVSLADETVPYGAINWDVMPYALASPNQADAGSCLFMATTGTMEILMNQRLPLDGFTYGGDTDLSERYLMNASDYVSSSDIRWWLSDQIYTYNVHGGSLLDRDYPFAVGYVKDSGNSHIKSDSMDPDAYLSMSYNWFDDLPVGWPDQLTPTPLAERTVIFIDPRQDQSSQWAVALMDDSTVEKIKYELRTKKAPVIVVYNHFLYWHADIIVGYDDTLPTNGCPMVDQSVDYYKEQGSSSYATAIEAHKAALGGCTNQGIFYVRDSIYDGTADEPTYDYGGGYYSDLYSKRIVERSYNWVKFLANHAYTVHRR
jgi:hypothetical protein